MSEKKVSTPALLLIIFIILLVGSQIFPVFYLLGIRVLGGGPFFHRMVGFNHGFSLIPFVPSVLLIIWLAVVIWVYKDASRRNMDGLLWALLVFIGNIIGLIVYLIVRSTELKDLSAGQSTTCPSCQKQVMTGYAFCPNCGAKLKIACESCGEPTLPDWKVCPHCGASLKKK